MPTPMLRPAFHITTASATLLLMTLIPRTARGQSAIAADSASPAAIAAGRKIYHEQGNCQTCHGASLEGTAVASSLQGHAWKDARGGSYQAIVGVIMKGVPGTAMVSHPGGITDDDARKVAAYVWAVSHGKAKS